MQQLGAGNRPYSRIREESFGSEVYLIEGQDEALILKFSHDEAKFWREIKTIEALQGNNILVPEILDVREPHAEFQGAILMRKLPGQTLRSQDCDLSLAEQCGVLLAQLHSVSAPSLGYYQKDGFYRAPFENWWSYRKDLLLGAWTKPIESLVEPEFIQKSHALMKHYYDQFSDHTLCWIHCDFRPGNILENDGTITGLIDFESSRTGDAAYDFVKFDEAFSDRTDLWDRFLKGYSQIRALPNLELSREYYQFELNYGFLRWAASRSDTKLFNERLANAKLLLDRHQGERIGQL